MRILNDRTVQSVNQEVDCSVLEVAKNDPGVLKFQSDHCKLMVECKAVIDEYIKNGHDLKSVDCIQILE